MDVYHKVLAKLQQVTGGKDSALVDLKDLVKGLGFLGNFDDIQQMLSGQGWIAETPKLNFVRITHWGVKEALNSGNGQPDAAQALQKETTKLIGEIKHLLIVVEEFSSDMTKDKFERVEKKMNEINTATGKLKSGIQ